MSLQIEFPFTLPRGYVDSFGQVQREGRMRLAYALDEIECARPAVQATKPICLSLLLSRVIVQLGTLSAVTPQVIAGLFVIDLAYLEDLYQRINNPEEVIVGAVCPQCSTQFQLQVAPMGI